MTVEKIFLGWHRPVLPAAVEWLREQLEPAGSWLPDAITLVVPTSEARWRLLELLVDAAGPSGLTPPRIVTPGALPELLY